MTSKITVITRQQHCAVSMQKFVSQGKLPQEMAPSRVLLTQHDELSIIYVVSLSTEDCTMQAAVQAFNNST